MSFSGMIKLKLKFFKNMYNETTKKYQFYFSFILEKFSFLKKRRKIIRQKNIPTVRRRKKLKEKEVTRK